MVDKSLPRKRGGLLSFGQSFSFYEKKQFVCSGIYSTSMILCKHRFFVNKSAYLVNKVFFE